MRNLIEAAYSGFRQALNRNDLPSVVKLLIWKLGQNGIIFVWFAWLVWMNYFRMIQSMRYGLKDAVLSRLIAFQLTYGNYNDSEWFRHLYGNVLRWWRKYY